MNSQTASARKQSPGSGTAVAIIKSRDPMDAVNFSQAYLQGIQRTINFLLSRGVPHDMAPDIAQSAWTRGWERLEQLRDESTILAWINTIALNQFRRRMRSNQHELELKPAHFDSLATDLNWAAIDMARILEACSPKDRALLESQLLGTTPKELAEKEGVSQTAIRIRLLRARRSARQLCEPAVPLLQAA
jgi:RNA polymerase sigma factor (sigma-70 family)